MCQWRILLWHFHCYNKTNKTEEVQLQNTLSVNQPNEVRQSRHDGLRRVGFEQPAKKVICMCVAPRWGIPCVYLHADRKHYLQSQCCKLCVACPPYPFCTPTVMFLTLSIAEDTSSTRFHQFTGVCTLNILSVVGWGKTSQSHPCIRTKDLVNMYTKWPGDLGDPYSLTKIFSMHILGNC